MKITAMTEPGFARIVAELIDERLRVLRETMENCKEHPEQIEALTYRYTELSVARDTLATMLSDHGEEE